MSVERRELVPDLDAYAPAQIAERVEVVGVAKAKADAVSLGVLGVLAGAFISLGGVFFAVAVTGSDLGFGPTRLLGGAAFSLGLILVVVAGRKLGGTSVFVRG
jgi:formate/nitrite transporter FocA (FNT family)